MIFTFNKTKKSLNYTPENILVKIDIKHFDLLNLSKNLILNASVIQCYFFVLTWEEVQTS